MTHGYSTFKVTINGDTLLVTSSARKALRLLQEGAQVEVWRGGSRVETIHDIARSLFDKYVEAEREYIRAKQAKAEERNKRRKQRRKT